MLDRIDSWLFAAPVFYVFIAGTCRRHEAHRHPRLDRLDRPERARRRRRAHPDRLRVVALSAGENVPRLAEQVAQYAPDTVAMASSAGLAEVRAGLRSAAAPLPVTTACGAEGLIAVATHPDADVVLFASSGTAALDAVLAAIDGGKTIALANKEILVMAGAIVMERARRRGVAVLPGRQRAQRDSPVPARPRAARRPPAHPHGLRRSVPRVARRRGCGT